MIEINLEKCIGCGKCVDDCFPYDIVLKNDKAEAQNVNCIKCGHCIAICPVNAVSITDYDMAEVTDYDAESFEITSEKLLNFIKFRRAVRQFKDKPVEKNKIEQIIKAGRFTPTASNRQPVSYIVVQDELPELTKMALESLAQIGKGYLKNKENETPLVLYYAERWMKMYEDCLEKPEQPTSLFFNASNIILVVSDSPIDGGLAASSMELMTHALGLGMFYSGFFVRAANNSEKLRTFLGLEDDVKKVIACLVMGYPDVEYQRTVPRKKPEISWR